MEDNKRKFDESRSFLRDDSFLSKDEPVFEALGTLDELSCNIGLLAVLLEEEKSTGLFFLRWIQERLMEIMSQIAVSMPEEGSKDFEPGYVKKLVAEIDELKKTVNKQSGFILSGGSRLSSQAHIVRAVCRRAERRVVTLHRSASVPAEVISFLNRLSEYFFFLACRLDESHRKN